MKIVLYACVTFLLFCLFPCIFFLTLWLPRRRPKEKAAEQGPRLSGRPEPPAGKARLIAGWSLIGVGVFIFLICLFGAIVSNDVGETLAGVALLLLAMLGSPGIPLVITGTRRHRLYNQVHAVCGCCHRRGRAFA